MLELKFPLKKKLHLGLALGGGGAKGLAHIEFLKILDELEIKPAIISGTSLGAMIGAMYCSGLNALNIEEFYKKTTLLELSKLIDLAIPAIHGLVKGDRIVKFLTKEVGLTTFEDLQIPLKIIATDYWNKKQVILNHGNLVKAIRASISVPGIFEPVHHLGRILTDGGAVNPVPFDIIREECDILVAIDVTGRQRPDSNSEELPNIFDCIINSFHIMESSLLENKLAKSKPDFLYQPDIINTSIIDFTHYDEIIEYSLPELKCFREDMLKLKPRLWK
ncbi:MAG: patatin-like phospholipase family protein [Candidatus Cloacimonetes bacterium]|nr:patatin-like phospholipase family protein [Candidatus Cloacimonadota bacterium]